MTDKPDHNQIGPLSDTQKLVQDVDPADSSHFSLEDILAEYGDEKPVKEFSSTPHETSSPSGKVLLFPGAFVREAEDSAPAEETPSLQADEDFDSISPEELFGLPVQESPALKEIGDVNAIPVSSLEDDSPASGNETDEALGNGEFLPISMEDIVASTVDAVKEEQAAQQEKLRKKLEKERKKNAPKPVKRRKAAFQAPLPQDVEEPAAAERASWHKRWYHQCRKSMLCCLPVLVLLWLPWLLQKVGVSLSFFGTVGSGNEALCVLIPQAVLCVLAWPVFFSALESLRERTVTFHTMAALCSGVTLLDAVMLLFLPARTKVTPLGSVAATIVVFCLWGLMSHHKGLWDSFRTAAMGKPAYLADVTEHGVAKGSGSSNGFYTRLHMEDSGSQWQRLMLPLIAVTSLVFGLLSSVGQGRSQDFLWCWSAVLCAATSLVYPLVYCVPFGLLAARLNRSGSAVAGHYGACVLASCRQVAVTDSDLFPQGTVSLNGLKLYGEERNRAISYTATLAVQGGGCLGRIFEDICRSDRISYQELEHFHIHDDGGLSGMIHGETVLVGPPVFMRHRGVRLPATLPAKTTVCLAVDGELTAVFAVKYNTSPLVEGALHSLNRCGLHLALAVRDGNITSKLLKTRFGTDGNAVRLEISDRLSLSSPEHTADGPNGLLYRDGLFPFVELVSGSCRLCHIVSIGNLLSLLSSIFGCLLSFYLTFSGNYSVLSPIMLLTYLLLWVLPVLPLLWGIDKT